MGFRDSNFSSRGSSEGFGERRSFGGGSRGGFRGGSRGGFGGRRSFGPREMTKIICAKCGKEDEVPFKPREGSEVLCKDCYFKEKGIEPRNKPVEAQTQTAPTGEVKEKKQETEDVEFSEEAEFDDAEVKEEEI